MSHGRADARIFALAVVRHLTLGLPQTVHDAATHIPQTAKPFWASRLALAVEAGMSRTRVRSVAVESSADWKPEATLFCATWHSAVAQLMTAWREREKQRDEIAQMRPRERAALDLASHAVRAEPPHAAWQNPHVR